MFWALLSQKFYCGIFKRLTLWVVMLSQTSSKQTVCWPSLPVCLHCQFTTKAAHHKNDATYPPNKHNRYWSFKMKLILILPCFWLQLAHQRTYGKCGQTVELKLINQSVDLDVYAYDILSAAVCCLRLLKLDCHVDLLKLISL